MKVIAVVPAWNPGRRLAPVVEALGDQCAQTIVVDNASTDGCLDALGPSDVVVLRNEANLGWAAAVNRGAREALSSGADAVLLVNDDAEFSPGSVGALATALAGDARAAAATAKMVYSERRGVLNGAGGLWLPHRCWAQLRGAGEPDDGRYDGERWADYPSGASSLLSGRALSEVGFFDEEYFLYYDDADWGLRAGRAGLRVRYVPEAVVYHLGSAGTAADPARRRYYNVRNRLRFAARHAPATGRGWAILGTLVLMAKQPARWVDTGRRRDAEAVLVAVADHVRGRYGRSGRFG